MNGDTIFLCFLSFITLCMSMSMNCFFEKNSYSSKIIYVGIGPFTFVWFIALIVLLSLGYK
jgi:hypothetical protein